MRKVLFIIVVFYLMVASCHRSMSVVKEEMTKVVDSTETSDINWNDSFIVIYRQPVNGYKVKAIAKLASSDVDIISADLTFTKDGKSFTLHTQCFGDTVYSKGRLDYNWENPEIFKRFCSKTIQADYHEYKEKGRLMPMYTPFFFRDLDFDGVEELVIVHHSMGVRYHDGYDIYRIVEGEPFGGALQCLV